MSNTLSSYVTFYDYLLMSFEAYTIENVKMLYTAQRAIDMNDYIVVRLVAFSVPRETYSS